MSGEKEKRSPFPGKCSVNDEDISGGESVRKAEVGHRKHNGELRGGRRCRQEIFMRPGRHRLSTGFLSGTRVSVVIDEADRRIR